jgi:hypothetical protein
MFFILRQKFLTNTIARKALLNTGVKYLLNASEDDITDAFWGVAMDPNDPELLRVENINRKGYNWLGQSESFIRHQIRHFDVESFERLYPQWLQQLESKRMSELRAQPVETPFIYADEE